MKKLEHVKFVAVSHDEDPSKLVEHQKKNKGADMYLPSPVTAEYFQLIENIFFAQEEEESNPTSTQPADPTIKFDLSSIEDELKMDSEDTGGKRVKITLSQSTEEELDGGVDLECRRNLLKTLI